MFLRNLPRSHGNERCLYRKQTSGPFDRQKPTKCKALTNESLTSNSGPLCDYHTRRNRVSAIAGCRSYNTHRTYFLSSRDRAPSAPPESSKNSQPYFPLSICFSSKEITRFICSSRSLKLSACFFITSQASLGINTSSEPAGRPT